MTRAAWSDEKDTFLIKTMIDQARAGKRADSGFKKEAWTTATDAFNTEFADSMTVLQIKTRIQTLKTKHTMVKTLLGVSGFSWDLERNVVLVEEPVWQEYLKEHPKAADYRFKPVPYYFDLVELFDGTYATGVYALASDEPSPSDFEAGRALVAASTSRSSQAPAPASLVNSDPPASSSDQDAGETGKKRKRDSGGVLIADAINQVAEQMRQRTIKLKPISASQRAVRVLQRSYKSRLSTETMVSAFDIMLDDAKAKIFIVMEEGAHRDAWLYNQLGISE